MKINRPSSTKSEGTDRNRTVKNLCLTSMFTALITLMTVIFRIPTGVNGGYIHMGDAVIYLAASLLPLPCGLLAAGVGGFLADVLSGALLWAPATFAIKILVALLFTSKQSRILCRRNIAALFPAYVITALGYFLAESLIFDTRVALISSVGGNFFQSLGSAVLYILVAMALDRMDFKKLKNLF